MVNPKLSGAKVAALRVINRTGGPATAVKTVSAPSNSIITSGPTSQASKNKSLIWHSMGVASGILPHRRSDRVLGINMNTVMSTLKKKPKPSSQ